MAIKKLRTSGSVMRRYTDVNATLAVLRNKKLSFTKPTTWFDRNDAAGLALFAKQVRAEEVFGFCLTGVAETSHHWQLFSGHSHGVCIVFDKAELIKAFDTYPDIQHGPVEYLDVAALRKQHPVATDRLPFLKRKTFGDEKEYRAVATSIFPGGETYDVDIKMGAIRRIVAGPAMAQNLYLNLKAIIHDLEGCASLKVTRSTLPNNGAWNTALRTGT